MEEVDVDNTPLTFGKYKGRTPGDIVEIDPGFIIWMWATFNNPEKYMTSALHRYAQDRQNESCEEEDREIDDVYNIGGW